MTDYKPRNMLQRLTVAIASTVVQMPFKKASAVFGGAVLGSAGIITVVQNASRSHVRTGMALE